MTFLFSKIKDYQFWITINLKRLIKKLNLTIINGQFTKRTTILLINKKRLLCI